WKTHIPDCRKRVIWLILSRYAINNRKMTHQEAFVWIKNWVDRCDAVTTVTGLTDEFINYYVGLATDSGYFPPSISTLENYGWKMNGSITLIDLIKNEMKQIVQETHLRTGD
ncbi:MAG: DNA primase noncatalytic subunit PriX, partial [Acidobacteriota bacterium]